MAAEQSPESALWGSLNPFGGGVTIDPPHTRVVRVLFLGAIAVVSGRGTGSCTEQSSRAEPDNKSRAIMALSQITAAGALQMANMCGR